MAWHGIVTDYHVFFFLFRILLAGWFTSYWLSMVYLSHKNKYYYNMCTRPTNKKV